MKPRIEVIQHIRRRSARGPWFVLVYINEQSGSQHRQPDGHQFRQATSAWFDPGSFWPKATEIEGNSPAGSFIPHFHSLIWLFTKPAQSTGSENTDPERTFLGRVMPRSVNSPCCTTFENMDKIRPQRSRETLFESFGGGADGTGIERSFVDAARFARIF